MLQEVVLDKFYLHLYQDVLDSTVDEAVLNATDYGFAEMSGTSIPYVQENVLDMYHMINADFAITNWINKSQDINQGFEGLLENIDVEGIIGYSDILFSEAFAELRTSLQLHQDGNVIDTDFYK